MEHNATHEEKQLYGNPPREEFCIFTHLAETMEKEAAFVAGEIRGLLDAGCSPQEIAVLFRTRHNSLVILERELVRAGVPCTRAGRDYSDPQQDLKGMVDYLHVIHSEHNSRALRRVLSSGPCALSKDDLNALGRFYRERQYRRLFDALEDIHELESFQGEKEGFCRKIHALVCDLRQEEAQPSFLLRRLARRLEGDFPLEGSASDSRRKAFENLVRQAEETERRLPLSGLTEFLSSVSLTPDTLSPQEGENTVRLLTIHGAKGLEWQYVFLVALEEGILPHYRAKTQTEIEEERRSFYVAMTRAKERLYLSCAGEREYGKEQRAVRKQSPSRFLEEIPKGLMRVLKDTEQGPLPLL